MFRVCRRRGIAGTGGGGNAAGEVDTVALEDGGSLDLRLVLDVLGLEHALVVAEEPGRCEDGLVAEARGFEEAVVVACAVAVADWRGSGDRWWYDGRYDDVVVLDVVADTVGRRDR